MSKMSSDKNIIRDKYVISESYKGTDQLHMWYCTSGNDKCNQEK